ncbi:hypothetical protein, partial [Paraburkholderia hospita]|uniref:hypothetical protein n=1 Tax=Paraburkholderia hospita TaxID=169430 RepID=UPI001A981745
SEAQDAGRDFHVPIRLFLRIGTRSISPKKSEYSRFAVYIRLFISGLKAGVFRPRPGIEAQCKRRPRALPEGA